MQDKDNSLIDVVKTFKESFDLMRTSHELEMKRQRESFHLMVQSFDQFHKMMEVNQARIELAEKRSQRDTRFVAIISTAVSLAVIVTGLYWNNVILKESQRDQFVLQEYRLVEEKQKEVAELQSIRKEVMRAMTHVRSLRDWGIKQCVYGKYSGLDKANYYNKMNDAIFEVVSSAFNAKEEFGSEVDNKILSFDSLIDIDKMDICDKNAKDDSVLKPLQIKIDDLMLKLINKKKEEKENILRKIR